MKYLIKESQIDLLNEVERHWMDREDETQYNLIKDMLVSFVMSIFDSYGENNNELVISDTDDKILFSFNKKVVSYIMIGNLMIYTVVYFPTLFG